MIEVTRTHSLPLAILLTAARDRDRRVARRGVARRVGAGDGDSVDAARAGAGALGAQLEVVRVNDEPVGRGVAVVAAVDGLVARDAERAAHAAAQTVRRAVAD